jgi:hypothetical protein
MLRSLPIWVVAAALWLIPAQLPAGGLPRLCLPVDGVTADNAEKCARRLAESLGDKVERVAVRQNEKQWYATFHFNRERVALSDIDAAFQGTSYSVARDRLRLFGDVILEIEPGKASAEKLMAELGALKYVTVGQSERKDGRLLVTLTMPYPDYFGRRTADFGKAPVSTESFGSALENSAKTEPPAKLNDLPTYDGLREVVQKHEASLTGLRWHCWGCRVLGGAAARP